VNFPVAHSPRLFPSAKLFLKLVDLLFTTLLFPLDIRVGFEYWGDLRRHLRTYLPIPAKLKKEVSDFPPRRIFLFSSRTYSVLSRFKLLAKTYECVPLKIPLSPPRTGSSVRPTPEVRSLSAFTPLVHAEFFRLQGGPVFQGSLPLFITEL